MQLSSGGHDLPAPSRAGCLCGVVCGGVLELFYGLLWESCSSWTQGQDRADPSWFLAGQEAAGSGLGFTSPWMPAGSKGLSPFPKDPWGISQAEISLLPLGATVTFGSGKAGPGEPSLQGDPQSQGGSSS